MRWSIPVLLLNLIWSVLLGVGHRFESGDDSAVQSVPARDGASERPILAVGDAQERELTLAVLESARNENVRLRDLTKNSQAERRRLSAFFEYNERLVPVSRMLAKDCVGTQKVTGVTPWELGGNLIRAFGLNPEACREIETALGETWSAMARLEAAHANVVTDNSGRRMVVTAIPESERTAIVASLKDSVLRILPDVEAEDFLEMAVYDYYLGLVYAERRFWLEHASEAEGSDVTLMHAFFGDDGTKLTQGGHLYEDPRMPGYRTSGKMRSEHLMMMVDANAPAGDP